MTVQEARAAAPTSRRRLSEMLSDIANEPGWESIAISDLRAAMGDRAFGALLFIFAAPNALPVNAPGVSTVLGTPILFLALQLVLGFRSPWLPGVFLQRSMKRQTFARAVNVIVPWLRRIERLLRPRLVGLASGLLERLAGLVIALLAVVLTLPIPFGNMPPAVVICVLALAILERDGLAVLVGLAGAAAVLFFTSGLLFAAAKAVSLFLRHLLEL